MTQTVSKSRPRPGGVRQKRPVEGMRKTVPVDADVLAKLRPAATARGMSVPKLVRRLLAVIVDDDMIDAILDDMGDDHER